MLESIGDFLNLSKEARRKRKVYPSQQQSAVLTARVPQAHAIELRAIAAARGQSLNSLLGKILADYLEAI